MLLKLESSNDIQKWLKMKYFLNLEEEHLDIQHFKNKIFSSSLYEDAKKYLSYGTVSRYRKIINSCGNNRRRTLNRILLSLGNSVYKKMGTV